MESNEEYETKVSPETGANICSKIFFCWTLPFFKYGYRNHLKMEDVYQATKDDLSGPLGDKLERYWKNEVQVAKKLNRPPSLQKVIFKTFFKSYVAVGILVFFYSVIFRLLQPIILGAYIRYFETSSEDKNPRDGWMLAIFLELVVFASILLEHNFSIRCQRIGMRIRTACCSLMYRKLLKLNKSSLGKITSGKLINLLSNDVQRFDLAAQFLHFIWTTPIHFMVAFYIMWRSVGWAAMAGMTAVAIQTLPIQGYLSKIQGQLRYNIALKTDYRVKLMGEITSGIQVIKMYAWEIPFQKIVERARKSEIKIITKTSYIRGILDGTLVYSEKLCLYLTLVTHLLLGNKLTGDVVFSLAQLFNVVQFMTVGMFRLGLQFYSEAKTSIKRIQEFLLLEENEDLVEQDVIPESLPGTIKVIKVNCEWSPNMNTLVDINFALQPGSLCCVVGNVGAGKSSLLQMLLNEIPLITGDVRTYGKVSYSSQDPWLFSSSVKNNILFGKPFNSTRYNDVIKACALEADLAEFPHGDSTLVGERGVCLSGGQRARINLARAVYSEADIYLLDDPLSAVDTKVGKHLFEECIQKYLDNKTRILVTHQLQFLKSADHIIIMNKGRIIESGTFDKLANEKLNVITHLKEDTQTTIGDSESRTLPIDLKQKYSTNNDVIKIAEEEMETGSVQFATHLKYWRAGTSITMFLALIIVAIAAQLASNSCELWLRYWTNNGQAVTVTNIDFNHTDDVTVFKYDTVDRDEYIKYRDHNIIIYSICILSSIILITLRSVMFFKICMNNSKALHGRMFSCILQAPMRFFDSNPSGRILNRFSKDMGSVDELLPIACHHTVQIFFVLTGILAIAFIVSPIMVVPTILLALLFYFIRMVYLASAEDIKRLEGIARAPVLSHTTSSIHGLTTIRASKAEQILTEEFDSLQNRHVGAWFLFVATSECFGMYLDIISGVFVTIVTLQFLFYTDQTSLGGNVGLVMSSCLALTGVLQFGIRQTADITSYMISVERILQYTKLEKESSNTSTVVQEDVLRWPRFGKICMKNVSLRYSPEKPPVLKSLNLELRPKEKVGIVGRTGAGKTSIINALLRLSPIEGIITIDDVDTSTVDLKILRSNMSIIPQEPVLFSGTIRYNLDPFDAASDESLWKALESVELKGVINDLNKTVDEGGGNFSVGQRQLICLARAIVRNNKILVMDEATANVDHVTDALIQKTIRENFKDCTVLTIAHRLNTVMDSDKVLVIEAGCNVEFDHAHNLLQKPDGYLTAMVKGTGPVLEAILRELAERDFKQKFS